MMDRRTLLKSAPAAVAAAALPGEAEAETPVSEMLEETVAALKASATPHAGAADRWTVVRKEPLDALFSLMDGANLRTETPITKLFREWLRARAEEDAAFDYNAEDEDACDAAFERRMRIEERMMAEPSRTTLDWIMKVSAYTAFGVFAVDDRSEPNLWVEARALVGR